MPKTRNLIGGLMIAALVAQAPLAHAATDSDVQRLNEAGHSLKWNLVPPGKSARYGHAEVLIQAPFAAVRNHVTAFSQYKDLVPQKFNNARVIAKQNPTTDVYFQVAVMHGLVTLWQVLRFGPPQVVKPGLEVVEGKFVRGNVKDANIVWTVKQIDENFTVLKLDLLIDPSAPAPQAALDEELRDAALQAVDAIHDRAQGHARTVFYTAMN